MVENQEVFPPVDKVYGSGSAGTVDKYEVQRSET
jgi:hypothetical protein